MRALRFCTTSLTMPGSTNSPDRFSSFSAQFSQRVEELARLRALHFEALGEVREQLRFAHSPGLCHHVPPMLVRADDRPRRSCARV